MAKEIAMLHNECNGWTDGSNGCSKDGSEESVDRVKQILDAKCASCEPQSIIDRCEHSTEDQKKSLLPIMEKHRELFDGTLGK